MSLKWACEKCGATSDAIPLAEIQTGVVPALPDGWRHVLVSSANFGAEYDVDMCPSCMSGLRNRLPAPTVWPGKGGK